MATTTIHTCDKCKQEIRDINQKWVLKVTADSYYTLSRFQSTPLKELEVCRPCLESFGIHVKTKPTPDTPPPPTVEELFTELVQRCQLPSEQT
jgi:hypothetical protein